MSKTTASRAKKAPAKKPAPAGKASRARVEPTRGRLVRSAKSVAKPGAKSASRPRATPARKPSGKKPAAPVGKSARRTSAKPAVKPAGKHAKVPVAKTPVKPATQPRAKSTATGSVKNHSEFPVKTNTTRDVQPTPAPKPALVKPVTVRASRPGKAPTVMPISPPSPLTSSRFADRFAPPRPPTRQMSHALPDVVRTPHKVDPKLANAWKTKSASELTEAELMSMPDAEYMNEKQLEFFRIRLQRLKDDLLSNAGETTEHLREDTSIVPDPADRATIEEEHALELRTRDRERKLLKKISQSLVRIDSGDYGFCDETSEPIGLGRLIARPTATLSLEAQQRRELKQKMFGD